MTKAILLIARQRKPSLGPSDVIVAEEGGETVIKRWDASLGAQPTADEITAAQAQVDACEQLRASLRSAFGALEPGVRVFFGPTFEKIRSLLSEFQVTAAKSVLETLPVPASLEAQRAAMLALFP